MLWVYKNFFFLLNNQTFFYKNFFLLNYFNFYLLSYNLISKNNFINKKILKKINHLPKKDNIMFKYIKYFNNVIEFKGKSLRINQLNYLYNYKNKHFFSFNSYNLFFFNKLIDIVYLLIKNNYNYMVLDKSYKNIFPLYNYLFKFNNLLIYKKYFFIKTNLFTYPNWIYFLNSFLKKFNIIFIIILNYNYFKKFFKNLKNINLPISALVPVNVADTFVDYPVFFYTYNNIESFLFFNLLSQITLLSLNYKNYNNKIKYLNLFYSFSSKSYF